MTWLANRSRRLHNAEWIPFSMRFGSIITLVACLLLSIVALEIINARVQAVHGLTNPIAIRALRYAPTVVAILLSLAWKSLCSDFALITPWAAMSGRWATASSSLLVNYIDDLDVVSIYTAYKHKHWALFFVMSCGLISGATVALANSLSVVQLNGSKDVATEIGVVDKFVFNGSMAMPVGWQSLQPFLNLEYFWNQASDIGGLPYFTTYHAYQAFDVTGLQDVIANGTVNAFSATLDCLPLNYTGSYNSSGFNSSFTLTNHDNVGCSLPISQEVLWPYNSSNIASYIPVNQSGFEVAPFLWLNVTACNSLDDLRLLATVMALDIPANLTSNATSHNNISSNVWTSENIAVRSHGFMCTPHYWSTPAEIFVNTTTGQVLAERFQDNATVEIEDIGIGVDLIEALMNNPVAVVSQQIFKAAATNAWSTAVLPNSYDWSQFSRLQVMQRYGYLYLYEFALQSLTVLSPPCSDTFFEYIVESDPTTAWNLFNNATMFETYTSQGFTAFVALLAAAAARAPENTTIKGNVIYSGEFVFIRQPVLRALESALALLAIVALLTGIVFRPRSVLKCSPATLNFITHVLGDSPELERNFIGTGALGQKALTHKFRNMYCRFEWLQQGGHNLQLSFKPLAPGESETDQLEMIPVRGVGKAQSVRGSYIPVQMSEPVAIEEAYSTTEIARYRPFSQRSDSRLVILICLILVIIVSVILQRLSVHLGGFGAGSSTVTAAWALVPSTIVILVGYGVQGLEHSTLTLENYRQLARNNIRSGEAITRQQTQDSSKILLENWSMAWTSVLFPCFLLLMSLPVLKILVGNLFHSEIAAQAKPVSFPVDVGPWNELNHALAWMGGSETFVESISVKVSQELAPHGLRFLTPQLVGSLNLPTISQNFTGLAGQIDQTTQPDTLNARVPALNTSIVCTTSEANDFNLYALTCNSKQGYKLQYGCASEDCVARFGEALSTFNITTTVASNITSWNYFTASYPSSTDDSIVVLLADFSPLNTPGLNFSSITCKNSSNITDQIPIAPDRLGSHMPKLYATNCTRTINQVHANVSFTNSIGSTTSDTESKEASGDLVFQEHIFMEVEDLVQQLQWVPTSYDVSSITYINHTIAANVTPAPMLMIDGGSAIYHIGNTLNPMLSPYDFLSLLAQYQEVQSGNQLDLLDVDTLASATGQVLQRYSAYAILVGFSKIAARDVEVAPGSNFTAPWPAVNNQTFGGTFAIHRPVIKQNLGFTIPFVILLGLASICVLVLFVTFPRTTLLPKAPSSIAAQMSLLAGSRLVEEVRQSTAATGEPDSNVFSTSRKFGLGWWSVTKSTNPHFSQASTISSKSGEQMRYGIDMGDLEESDRRLKAYSVPTPTTPSSRTSLIPASPDTKSPISITRSVEVSRFPSLREGWSTSDTTSQPRPTARRGFFRQNTSNGRYEPLSHQAPDDENTVKRLP